MNRRKVLKNLGLTGFLPFSSLAINTGKAQSKPARSLRIAHLTDIHLEDVKEAPKKLSNCLHQLQNMDDRPDIIFNGGDTIMDALARKKDEVEKQWQLWDQVISQEVDMEIVHCIGNHDVWGAGDKNDPLYGKKYAMEKMQIEKPYYSFTKNGWQFIILDSTHPINGNWYTGKLDEEQFEWLEHELSQLDPKLPILVMSHIPILTATGFYEENRKENTWTVPGGWMHIDFNRIKKLFLKHPNVKLCISGHMHLLDYVEYNGVCYLCNGAVSGSWWGNKTYHETEAGFAIIDLFEDGSFSREYITHIWG